MTEQPIAAVATTITAFVGSAPSGPIGRACVVTSMSHFSRLFGGLWPPAHLGYSVRDYYRHGGRVALIVRTDPEVGAVRAQLDGIAVLASRRETGPLDDPPGLLVVPPWGLDAQGAAEPSLEVLREIVTTAERLGAFAVLDAPGAWAAHGSPDGAADVLESLRSAQAAMYFPRLLETDPLTGEPVTVSPSGAVAGIIARTDALYGPWSVPAGTATSALDVKGLTVDLDEARTEGLAQLGINVIRSFPGTGPIVWGARVLGSDPDWSYVPTSRTAMFLRHSIEAGLRWTVVEPNGEPLWERVRLRVEEFLGSLLGAGAFPGTRPEEAYTVRCDRSTMTESDLARGILRMVVGFAPVRPAEFRYLDISLAVGQA
ncbi:MAG: phage tail sheath subtilisin-like domain-containing protein [Intrasporangium sp.]|uniref:phage tail sheath family protein n=1 Tax=Intrasporangium sp. TaxID=1925024 RepID=UPI00264828D4|nr:phage tail sheath subtilisin-like domain-containing protein [Intrasporangium sp.]MDN5797386.1 phage tail sheath subtilisin-like domain-containing protein [Intrasporangium sp.]